MDKHQLLVKLDLILEERVVTENYNQVQIGDYHPFIKLAHLFHIHCVEQRFQNTPNMVYIDIVYQGSLILNQGDKAVELPGVSDVRMQKFDGELEGLRIEACLR